MARKFNPAHMARLEGSERRRTLEPERVFAALGLTEGQTFLDLGCGPGFFSLPAAEAVGPTGRVLAVDVATPMVERVRERAAERGLTQVQAVPSEEAKVPLPDGVADAALIANVLHEAEDPMAFLREARRLLRRGGRLAIVDWKQDALEHGPPAEHRLAPERVRALLVPAGFGDVVDFAAGPSHYGIVASRP